MLNSNDYQIISQLIRNEMERMKDPELIKTKLKEAQHEANFLSAQLCAKEKQLQQVKELLETAEWLDEGEELVIITRKEYFQILNAVNGGSQI